MAKRFFERDFLACLTLSDARKRENAARRASCQANASLCSVLLEEAKRRGKTEIDWESYFRNGSIS
jgi:hypothetical protein